MFKNIGKLKRELEEYAVLTAATLILVVGVYVFKFPNNFSFGGVTGIAVVLAAVLPFSPGDITFIINMSLLVVGFIFLGKSFGIRTVYVSLADVGGLKPCGAVVSDGACLDCAAGAGADLCDRASGVQLGDIIQYRRIGRRYGHHCDGLKEIYKAKYRRSAIPC